MALENIIRLYSYRSRGQFPESPLLFFKDSYTRAPSVRLCEVLKLMPVKIIKNVSIFSFIYV